MPSCIGVGWTGSILARELTKAGLKLSASSAAPSACRARISRCRGIRDDLKYAVRQELFQDTQLETVSLRHSPRETALPIRRLGSFLPGTGRRRRRRALERHDLAAACRPTTNCAAI